MNQMHKAGRVIWASIIACVVTSHGTITSAIDIDDRPPEVRYKTEYGPCHQWIAYQAYKLLSEPMAAEFASYIGISNDDELSFNWSPPANWKKSPDDPASASSALLEGTWEEDEGGWLLWARPLNHFWNPYDMDGGQSAYNQGLYDYDSALAVAQDHFSKATNCYAANQTSNAYYWLGRTAHLLMDMSVPAHVNLDAHVNYDAYEATVGGDYARIGIDVPGSPDIPSPPGVESGAYATHIDGEPSGCDLGLNRLFYSLAVAAAQYGSVDKTGRGNYGSSEGDFSTDGFDLGSFEKDSFDVYLASSPTGIRCLLNHGQDYDVAIDRDLINEARLLISQETYEQMGTDHLYVDGRYSGWQDPPSWAKAELENDYIVPNVDNIRVQQDKLEAKAIAWVAGLYRLFWHRTHPSSAVSVLPAPETLRASPASSNQINLSWSDVTGEMGYKLERRIGSSGSWGQIASRPENVLIYSDTGLAARTEYQYQVRAYSNAVTSSYSDIASATTIPAVGSTRILSIRSFNPSSGVGINSWIGTGSFQSQSTPTSQNITSGLKVSVACPATLSGGLYFQKWKLDGSDHAYANVTMVTMDGNHTLMAVYVSTPPEARTLASLTVEGPFRVAERSSAQYSARAVYDDGSAAYVTPEWSDDTSFAHIDDNGILDTSAVSSDKEIEIEATYSSGSVTRSDTKSVTILNTDAVLTYTLTLDAENGRINPSPEGPSYAAGTEVRLTAYADDHYARGYWSGDASGTNRSVEITMNRDKSVAHHFQLNTNYGDITCIINPPAVNSAGAGWQVSGPGFYNDEFRESGSTVSGLEPKDHYVVFKDVYGWIKPADMVVAVEGGQDNQVNGTYVEVMGAIRVTIEPQASVEAGALWRVAGSGEWNAGGMCLGDVQPGSYTIEFMSVPDWQVPTSRVVNVSRGGIASTVGIYCPPPGMPIITTIYPSTGPLEGGTVLTIEGANFADAADVRIGGAVAESINIVTPTMITATVPPRASYGTVPVEIYSGGYTATVANGFSYMNPMGSNIELLGQIGGDVTAVAVLSNMLFYGEGPAFVVADVSNSAAPVERGRIALPNTIFHIAIRSNIAYAAVGGAGLYAIDVSNPASPAIEGLYDTEGGAYGVAVLSNTVYVADDTYGVQIFDASNPSMIQRQAYLPFAGHARRISAGIIGGRWYAFVAENDMATRIVDVTVPTAPVEITNIVARSGNGFTDVKVVGTNLYLLGDYMSSGGIYNVGNPANPIFKYEYPTEGGAYFDVAGTRLYSCGDELIAAGISGTPSELGRYDVDGADCKGVCVSNSVAYLAMGPEGVKIVSVSSPSSMTLRSTLTTMPQVNCVWATNGTALVGSSIGLFTLDVTSPSSPQRAGYLSGAVVDHLVSDSGWATLVDLGSATVRVVNVTNRYSPSLIGTYTNLKAYNVASMGSTSLIAGVSRTSGSLPVMDIMRVTSSAPVKIGSLSLASSSGAAAAVALNQNWAYIGQPNVSLDVVNITNPASPVKVGSVAITNHFREVASSTNGDYIYVADWALGIRIVDATNRASPKLGAVIDPAQTAAKGARCVRVYSNRLYATESDYLFVYDISAPASPQLIAYYDIPDIGYDVYVDGDILYVANDSDGLTILRMMDIDNPTIAITNPTANAAFSTTGATVSIGGIATDDKGIARVTWYNDRGGGGIAEGTTNWLAAGIKLASGNNRVTVTVEDNRGNIGRDAVDISASYEDGIAPAISIALPSPELECVASASVIEMSGPVSDNSQFATVSWTNMDGAGGGASVSGEVWIATGVVLRAGPNVIEVMATDGSGNGASDSVVVFYSSVDTNPPTVSVEFPAIDSVCDARYGAINLSGSATDDRGVVRVEYSINSDTQLIANGTSPWSANGVLLRPGFNAIEVVAYDGAGNSAVDTLAVTYIPPPVEMNAASMSNGVVQVHFSGPLGGPYILEASTNMNEWIPIQTNSITGEDPVVLPDVDNGSMPKRFYRITGE